MREEQIPDQRREWDAVYRASAGEFQEKEPSSFAREVVARFPPRASVLELGCGRGRDARFFAAAGHRVIASDFSHEALARNHQQSGDVPGLSFVVADTSRPLPFADQRFGTVYASLSLHYFRHDVTQGVFAEIARVLVPEGLLCFVCKSTADPLYGEGERVEEDMFVREGHVRHFFSESYARSCLAGHFEAIRIWSGRTKFYGEPSGFVKAIARCSP